VGQYQPAPDGVSFAAAMRQLFVAVRQPAVYLSTLGGLAVLGVCVWRAGSFRKRAVLVGCAGLLFAVAAAVLALPSRPAANAAPKPGIGIRREGQRLFAETLGPRSWPLNVCVPPNAGELLPLSKTCFFERLSGSPVAFFHDAHGTTTRLTVHHGDDAFIYEKVSDRPPEAAQPRKPRVVVKLDPELLEAFVGRYEFAPNSVFPAGIQATVWRSADQLFWQERGENAISGALEIYPESQTTFFTRIDDARLTFSMNAAGEATAVMLHVEGMPDAVGKKVADD
jgi:hypothetical protein